MNISKMRLSINEKSLNKNKIRQDINNIIIDMNKM